MAAFSLPVSLSLFFVRAARSFHTHDVGSFACHTHEAGSNGLHEWGIVSFPYDADFVQIHIAEAVRILVLAFWREKHALEDNRSKWQLDQGEVVCIALAFEPP